MAGSFKTQQSIGKVNSLLVQKMTSVDFVFHQTSTDPKDTNVVIQVTDVTPNEFYFYDGSKYVRTKVDSYGNTEFERLLEKYGAVFNGTTDDSAAIQNALTNYASDGKYKKAIFPPGGLTAVVSTASGDLSLVDANLSTGFVGFVIPGNLSVDGNGTVIDASTAAFGSGDYVFALGNATSASDPYDKFLTTVENFKFKGNSSFDGILFTGDRNGTGTPHTLFRRCKFDTATNIVTLADNSYNLRFQSCGFTGWSSAGYAVTSFGGSTNWGENLMFDGCIFFNGAGGVLRARSDAYAGYHFNQCAFDYVKQAFLCDSVNRTQITAVGCHFEQNTIDAKYAATQAMMEISATATLSQIHIVGGSIIIATGSSGNNLDYIAEPGNTGATAPYGIIFDRVFTSLNGVTINNAASTGRFVNNG